MKVVRAILLVINVLAALALLLTTLGGVVAPSSNIWPSLLAFGYLPMLALNVLFVIVWLLMKRWQFLVSVVAIAVRWSFVGLVLQVGGTSRVPDRAEHPQMVTLMTYNVHLFNGRDDDRGRSDTNALRFLDLVRSERPDILCMQEYAAPRRVGITDSLELLGYNHYYGSHTAKNGVPYGTVVFSQLPITYVKRIDGEKLMVELHRDGQRLRVVCLHMDSYRFDNADHEEIARMRRGEVNDSTSLRTIGKVKETILSHEREWMTTISPVVNDCKIPLVVAGDMNDVPTSWLHARLRERLTDTYCDCGSGLSITYDASYPAVRIDNVFRSEGLRTLSYRRIRTDISDHYPVMVALEFEQ